MKFLERFKASTISKNNREYLKYFKTYQSDIDDVDRRGNVVAWEVEDSQIVNWNLINKHIRQGDNVLDYGCGVGDMVTYFKKKRKKLGGYTGVDINPEYISLAKKNYPNNDFYLIKNINDVKGRYDVVCASGVFTWFITKSDFINALKKLYDISNREVLLTFNYSEYEDYKGGFWTKNYRQYNEEIFKKLFPEWNLKFEKDRWDRYLLVRIIK